MSFPPSGRFFPLRNGILHGFIIKAVGFKHQFFGVQKLRLKPRPRRLFGSHGVVFEKATGRKGRSSENTHPAHFLAANQRLQAEIQSNRYTYSQQGTDKLPGGKSKKDRFLIIPDFFWHFDFDKDRLPFKNRLYFSYF